MTIAQHLLWWVALEDLTAVLIILDQDCEALHILQLVARSLSVLNLTPNVSVAITVESLTTRSLLVEDFNVSPRERLAGSSVGHFKLTVLLQNVNLKIVRIVSQELLKITGGNLNHHVLVHKLLRE